MRAPRGSEAEPVRHLERQVAPKQRPCGFFERPVAPKLRRCDIFGCLVAPTQRPCAIFERQGAPRRRPCGIFQRQAAAKQRPFAIFERKVAAVRDLGVFTMFYRYLRCFIRIYGDFAWLSRNRFLRAFQSFRLGERFRRETLEWI